MNFSKSISKQFIYAFLGVLVSLFVLTQASVAVPASVDNQEQSDSGEEDKQRVTETAAVPTPSLQFNLDYQSYLLNEVVFTDDEEANGTADKMILPSATKAFKILLRQFISPNAP